MTKKFSEWKPKKKVVAVSANQHTRKINAKKAQEEAQSKSKEEGAGYQQESQGNSGEK